MHDNTDVDLGVFKPLRKPGKLKGAVTKLKTRTKKS